MALVEARELLSRPITTEEGEVIAQASDLIIDPTNGALLGFVVRRSLFSPEAFISIEDIREFLAERISVLSPEVIVAPGDIVRIAAIWPHRPRLFGAQAVTETGKVLGKVLDLVLDIESLGVVRFLISAGFFGARSIAANRVVRLEPRRVIFEDSVLEDEREAAAVPA